MVDPVFIELSKINFLLENLYALVFRELGADPEDIDGVADEMRRQISLPASTYGGAPTQEELRQFQEIAAQRLDMFFAGVRSRLRSDQDR